MLFELNSISGKLDHLTVTQEHTVRYSQRRLERAKLLEAQGELALAKTSFERLTNLSIPTVAQDAEIAVNRLKVRQILAELEQVSLSDLERLKTSLDRTPTLAQVWFKSIQFVITLKQGLSTEAMALGAALIQDPVVPDIVVFQYARLLAENKRSDEGRTVLNDFLKARPSSRGAWVTLGALQQAQKEYSKAIKSYEKALKLDPLPRDLLSTARLYMRQGQWGKANQLIEVNQFHADLQNEALKLKAACNFQLKAYEKSAELYQKAYERTPDPNTRLSRVIALQVAGQYDRALAAIEPLQQHEIQLPHIHFHRAQILIGTGMTAKAAQSFVQFLKLAGETPEHAKRVKHATKWMTAYQRSLIVPQNIQDNVVEEEEQLPSHAP